MFLRRVQALCGAISAAVFLVSAAQAAQPAHDDMVIVYRGASATTLHFPSNGPLQVQRGTVAKPPVAAAKAGDGANTRRVLAGQRLWVIDDQAGRLTTCAIRNSILLGRRDIRCHSRDLPASLSPKAD